MDYYVPKNVIKDPTLEQWGTTGTSEFWKTEGGIRAGALSKDEKALSGSYSWEVDSNNGIGNGSFNFLYQELDLKPFTSYNMSVNFFGMSNSSATDTNYSSDPYLQLQYFDGTTWQTCSPSIWGFNGVSEDEWSLRSSTVRTDAATPGYDVVKARIRYVCGSSNRINKHCYVDDFTLIEKR